MSALEPRIIVALDFPELEQARALVERLDPSLCRLKVGKTLFTLAGPSFVEELMAKGFDVFLDLKFHDIPQTVAGACASAATLGVWMMNVHISGGEAMLAAAVQALQVVPLETRPLLIGVTVLTSLEESDLRMLGIQESVESLVLRMAKLAQKHGLDGVVCSAQEATMLRAECGPDFLLVTPGIRLADDASGDQKRLMTPDAALAAGADYLVMGRSITQSLDPLDILKSLSCQTL